MTDVGISPLRAIPRVDSARLVLILVCAGQFMVILDSSIVNVALPTIQHDLGFGASGIAWVVNGYLLTFAGFMLLGGRAADLFGQRRVLVAGLALFTAASLVSGLAMAPGVLVAARVAQGLGAALLAPATVAVLHTRFTEPNTRARAFGAWSASGGVGGMAGALAGGAITTGLSWRWIFLINVPIGAILIALAWTALSGNRLRHREALDLTGAITGTAGLAVLIFGVMRTADHGWASPSVLGAIGAGVLLLVIFAVVQARFAAQPLMPLRLFGIRRVALGSGMLLVFGGIAVAMWYFTSLFLQNVLGYDAFRAGLGQTPAAVMFLVIARVAATLLPRIGARSVLLAGCACLLTGFVWLAQADAGSSYLTAVLGPTLFIAIGIGLTFPTLMATTTAAVSDGDAGIVGGIAGTANQSGGSIGLAALAAVAAARTAHESGQSPAVGLATGYAVVFLLAAGLSVVIAIVSLLLPRNSIDS